MAERQIADGVGETGFVEQAALGAEEAGAAEESESIDVVEAEPSRRAKSTVKFPYTDVAGRHGRSPDAEGQLRLPGEPGPDGRGDESKGH